MQVIEIFNSIEGEGKRTGELSTFIRFANCNLRCSYCDTTYAYINPRSKDLEIQQILNKIAKYNCKNITITGGEPLLQADLNSLVKELLDNHYLINIETNGSLDIKDFTVYQDCFITLDHKMKSSGYFNKMDDNNYKYLRNYDIVKCVVSESDLEDIPIVLDKINNKCILYISPIFNIIKPDIIVNYMKKLNRDGYKNIKLQLQMHKYIWPLDQRGI